PLTRTPTTRIPADASSRASPHPTAAGRSPPSRSAAALPAHDHGNHEFVTIPGVASTVARRKPDPRKAGLTRKLTTLMVSPTATPSRATISLPRPAGTKRTSARVSTEISTIGGTG